MVIAVSLLMPRKFDQFHQRSVTTTPLRLFRAEVFLKVIPVLIRPKELGGLSKQSRVRVWRVSEGAEAAEGAGAEEAGSRRTPMCENSGRDSTHRPTALRMHAIIDTNIHVGRR